MSERGNGWLNRISLLLALFGAGTARIASADETAQAPPEPRERSVLARSPGVRLRERPDDQAAIVALSLAGVRLRTHESHGDWLHVGSFWIRAADVVDRDKANDYFNAQLARAESDFLYLGRARAHLESDEYDRAQADISEALRLDPRSSRAYWLRALIAQELKQRDEATRNFDRAIELDAHDAILLESRGWNRLDRHEYDKAIADFDAALSAYPAQAESVLRGRGYAWYGKHEYGQAIADFDAALRLDPADARALAGRAAAHGSRQEYDAAIADADEAIRLNASAQNAFLVRGVARMYRGELESAETDLDEAVRLDASDRYAYRYRAQLRYRLKRFDSALSDYTQALSLDADDADTYLARAAVWQEKRDGANAILDLSEFLRRRPTRGDAFAQRGWLRLETDAEAAFSDFQEALRLDARSVSALLGRAAYWRTKEEFANTADDCTAVLAIEPENLRTLFARAEARLTLGQADKAFIDIDAACRASPTDATFLCYRAAIYNSLGNYARAIDDCHAALKLDARRVDVWVQLCSARLQRKDYALAIDDSTTAIALDAKNSYFWNVRAWCRRQLQQYDKAIADYDEVARLDPSQAQAVAKFAAYARQLQKAKDGGEKQASAPGTPASMPEDWRAGRPLDRAVKRFGESPKEPNEPATLIDLTADPAKLHERGRVAIGARKFAEAFALLTRAAANADDVLRPSIEHDLAWLLAICPDEAVRDGKCAVELAQKVLAAREAPNAGLCDTLAAAFAAQGDFSEAVRWQTKAIELQKKEALRERYRQRLALYLAGKPYRLP